MHENKIKRQKPEENDKIVSHGVCHGACHDAAAWAPLEKRHDVRHELQKSLKSATFTCSSTVTRWCSPWSTTSANDLKCWKITTKSHSIVLHFHIFLHFFLHDFKTLSTSCNSINKILEISFQDARFLELILSRNIPFVK